MIRRMRPEDISRVNAIEAEIFTSAWTEADFIYELNDNPFAFYFVWEHENVIEGYVGLWILFDQAQITTLGVDLAFRNQGIGKALMRHAMDYCTQEHVKSVTLEVRVSNLPAIKLYESFGFITKSIRKDYYQDNHEDAYLMVLERE